MVTRGENSPEKSFGYACTLTGKKKPSLKEYIIFTTQNTE